MRFDGDVDVDPELVRAVQRGDAGALDELVRATYAGVYRRCLQLLGDPADAADATQEVYVRVVRSVLGFRAEAAFGTWLHRVTVNVCLTALRRRGDVRVRGQTAGVLPFAAPGADRRRDGDEAVLQDADASPEDRLLAREGSARLRAAVAALPAGARAVVVLRDVRGLSTRETAEALGVSQAAVKVRLHRAHAELRRRVGTQTAAEPPDHAEVTS
ncbi:RNA polymerase sigma factor [Nitriliruptor alkaliphilus]|uniref:RNA polymerase sigma factor n=1 Tax=Nitriliruptor alkaliphilus TaxID=427918 RepID=UPI000696F058|nr:RNA polymerase sigma factor [Nitriliruptor alkaliphilus]